MSDPSLRRQLRARPDIREEDVDDIIELAQQRQDEARAAAEGRATVDEVKAVAAELDIAPEHVEAAIAALKERRAAAEEAAAARQREETRARKRRVALLRRSALGAGIVAVLLAALVGGLAMSGRSALLQAGRDLAAAEARADAVLDRQASLAPQLAALAGADPGPLMELQDAVRNAPDLQTRLAAADALSAEMARQLGQLPPPATDAEATARLNLQDEITGTQNRVTVELRRYNEAEARWEATADTVSGSLALALGLVDRP